jgi:hypothetical protein
MYDGLAVPGRVAASFLFGMIGSSDWPFNSGFSGDEGKNADNAQESAGKFICLYWLSAPRRRALQKQP